MSQHFLLSRAAKSLSLAQVLRMTDAEAETTFRAVRWSSTDGEAVCSHCGSLTVYACRRPYGAPALALQGLRQGLHASRRGRCSRPTSCRCAIYLAAIAVFCNEVKGKSMLAMSRDLGLSYKAAFVLCHKLREAMAAEMNGRSIGGDGTVAEVDGGLLRRLREARQPAREPRGPPPGREPRRASATSSS